jgi:hypothetical protein
MTRRRRTEVTDRAAVTAPDSRAVLASGLLSVLKGQRECVAGLLRVLDQLDPPVTEPSIATIEFFDVPSRDFARRRKVAEQLGKALTALEQAMAVAPEDLLNAVAGAAPHLHAGSLHDWQRDLSELADHTRDLARQQRGRPGAPVNGRRRRLELATARALKSGGLRLTKGRDGLLAKVLGLMYTAAGEPVPEDLFPILKRVVTAVSRPRCESDPFAEFDSTRRHRLKV